MPVCAIVTNLAHSVECLWNLLFINYLQYLLNSDLFQISISNYGSGILSHINVFIFNLRSKSFLFQPCEVWGLLMHLLLPKVDTLWLTALFFFFLTALFLTARNVTSKLHMYFSNISTISPFKHMQLILFSNSLQTASQPRRELCKYVALNNNLQAKWLERFLGRVKPT